MRLDAVSCLETRAQIRTHTALDTGASCLVLDPFDGNLGLIDQVMILRKYDDVPCCLKMCIRDRSLEESREYQEYILEETDHIEQYIQVLQEMLKTERVMQIKREKVDIKSLCSEFSIRAKSMTSAKKQHLDIVISLHSDYIMSDRQLLQRVWENLLHNAVEYTPQGGKIGIHITEDESRLYFQIEDSGPGFTEEDLMHGTEQFYQGDKSRSSRKHYGMGLFIVQSFVSQQGGRLILSNLEGQKGACVCLEIKKIQ